MTVELSMGCACCLCLLVQFFERNPWLSSYTQGCHKQHEMRIIRQRNRGCGSRFHLGSVHWGSLSRFEASLPSLDTLSPNYPLHRHPESLQQAPRLLPVGVSPAAETLECISETAYQRVKAKMQTPQLRKNSTSILESGAWLRF